MGAGLGARRVHWLAMEEAWLNRAELIGWWSGAWLRWAGLPVSWGGRGLNRSCLFVGCPGGRDLNGHSPLVGCQGGGALPSVGVRISL